ncbi:MULTISPECIES: DUF3048 domain-containing protein [Streptomyces]|uniref:CchlO n=2 Tax=Streptomyces TaxID=1883 RepID=A0A0W7WUX4_9ACTN|nr:MULTISPECIES: DUF3048 domain-containing protein [Streptomyces]KUF14367.1 hypothetical protein AT728_35950 [Streptomyces silvensis]MVO87132.1 DUF3048 domain-containing protein [Streptomyces typhae]
MTPRRRQWRAAAAVALLAALAPACTLQDRTGAGRDEKRADGGAEGRVLAVKIDNVVPARPQTGLDAADVVYAEQVEAGLSRLMAVYARRLPPVVGPVRSARETDLELLRQFDRPALAFSGAQHKLLPLIGRSPVRALPAEGKAEKAYYRSDDRPAPHNLYLRPAALGVRPEPSGLKSTGFTFGPPPEGGTPRTRHTVAFPSARFTFSWVEYEGRWHIAMDGDTARTPQGKALTAGTVVVQRVTVRDSRYHDRSGNPSPFTRTVGSGTAQVLREGRSYEARWERRTSGGGTRFSTPEGKPLAFAPGPVWVVFTEE